MKYLLIFLFISFQYLCFSQTPETELIIIENSIDTMPYLDVYYQDHIKPISNDSINHIDESNLKQGIWISSGRDIGNCTNSTYSNYNYYEDNKLLMSFIISSDNNACYPSNTTFLCSAYNDTGNIIFQMNNTQYNKPSNDYLWSCINNRPDKPLPGINYGYNFAKNFFEENISRKTKSRPKLTYKGKTLPGSYQKFEDGEPCKKSITRK